jgi:molybdate transport system ATP-binding protein
MSLGLHQGLHVRVRSTSPVPMNAQFDCAPGECVALVGASGSGKTTLLRTVAGLYRRIDLQGEVRLGPQEWMNSARGLNLPAQRRRVGLLFQQDALFPHLNALHNIAICADPSGAGRASAFQQKARHWLERLGLEALAHRMPHELSGGQQRRVALARALVRMDSEPTQEGVGGVLLLDEPFSAVDAPMRQVLYSQLSQLRQSVRVPIVMVTHDLHEAQLLADRLVVMDEGHSLQCDTPAQLMRSPRNARVAQALGIRNCFHARFEKTSSASVCGQAFLRWGSVCLPVLDKGQIDKGQIANGSAVTWVLDAQRVQLLSSTQMPAHPIGNAAAGPAHLLACTVSHMRSLGEITLCRLAVQGTQDVVELMLSSAQLRQPDAALGQCVALQIPLDAVHIMAPSD